MSFGSALLDIISKFEKRAEEPDYDIELRDEFFDWRDDDEEGIEKANEKLEQFLAKKQKHEEKRQRLKNSHQWQTDFEKSRNLEDTVNQTITIRK